MKVIKKLLFVLCSAALLTLLSCNTLVDENRDTDKAYINFSTELSSDLSRNVTVHAITLTANDVNKVVLRVEKIQDDGSIISVTMENDTWESLEEFTNTTLLIDKGVYNFYLDLYATGAVSESKFVQTGKIENKEIVTGENTLLFKTYFVATGELKLSWECENSAENPCPAGYAGGYFYKTNTPSDINYFIMEYADIEESDKRIFTFEQDKLTAGSTYMVQVYFYDTPYDNRQQGANQLYSDFKVVEINGYKTEKVFEISIEDIKREGSDVPDELEFDYELEFENSSIIERMTLSEVSLYYLPAKHVYAPEIKEIAEDYIEGEGGRKILKNNDDVRTYVSDTQKISTFKNDDFVLDNSTVKISGTYIFIPPTYMKGFFYMIVTYENESGDDSIECLAIPRNNYVLFKYNNVEPTLIYFDLYEINPKAITEGSITGDNGVVDISIEQSSDGLFINDAEFTICALDKYGKQIETSESDWTVTIFYAGKDITEWLESDDVNISFDEDGKLVYRINNLESAGTYQLYVKVNIDGIVSSQTIDISLSEQA